MNRWPGVNWVWLPEVDSTNSLAERFLEAWLADAEGDLPTTLFCADCQWAGRGRHNRVWHSPPGGLYCTLLSQQKGSQLAWLPLAAGVALREAVLALVPGVPVVLKWPNDLYVAGQKLGGVLCSSRVQGERAWTVTGLGLNVLTTPALGDEGRKAVALRDLGYEGSFEDARGKILDTFVTDFPRLLRESEVLRAKWLAASAHAFGDKLLVRTSSGVVEGGFAGLSSEGLLLLQVGEELIRLSAGELL